MAQINLSSRQKQTHRHSIQTCGCQEGGGEKEGWTGNLGLVDTNYYILEWINNKVLLYSTGNCIQSPGINHNGKEH